jgi:hypothetical protein
MSHLDTQRLEERTEDYQTKLRRLVENEGVESAIFTASRTIAYLMYMLDSDRQRLQECQRKEKSFFGWLTS